MNAKSNSGNGSKTQVSTTNQWQLIIDSTADDFSRIAAIDNVVHFERESRFALQIITTGGSKEYLQKCSTDSIRNAITNVASVGLTLNPAMKLAYLVPRDGLCCLDISYIGLIKLATDTGSVAAVKAEIVRKNDLFDYNGPMEKPVHKFNPFDKDEVRGDIIGVYVLARLTNGIDMIETLDIDEINKIKGKSKAANGPWKDWFEEMCKKAAIKRASKNWPRTERLALAEQILNEHEGNAESVQTRTTGNGAASAAAQQEADDASAKAGSLDPVKAKLEAAADKGTDSYKLAWAGLTKQQRVALKAEHTSYKLRAAKADSAPVDFTEVGGQDGTQE